jgi:hypothetical protein
MADDTTAQGSPSSLTPTHGVMLVLVTSAAVLGLLMAVGFRPKKSSK